MSDGITDMMMERKQLDNHIHRLFLIDRENISDSELNEEKERFKDFIINMGDGFDFHYSSEYPDFFFRITYCICPECGEKLSEFDAEQVCDCGCPNCRHFFTVEDYKLYDS